MTHTYQITGMTCSSCEINVKSALLMVDHVTGVEVSKVENSATITMERHVALLDLQHAIGDKYQISVKGYHEVVEEAKSWLETYKPIWLIFFYISLISSVIVYQFDLGMDQWLNFFMAQFFLTFSFFKMLNLKGFAESYAMYDIVAKRIPFWPYLYAFIELGLGISFLLHLNPFLTNLITLVVMSISIIGVLQSVLNKKKIKCACLGDVFNLPMSTVTLMEDGLMMIMSGIMLVQSI